MNKIQVELNFLTDEIMLLPHCAPIFFLPSDRARPSDIPNNGTVSLIDTGTKKLLVTCCHVWHGFVDYRDKNPSAKLGVIFANGFGTPEFLDEQVPVVDSTIDLAVFEARTDIWDMGKKEFYGIHRWPVPKGKIDEPIAFLGFPGEGRRASEHVGSFRYHVCGSTVEGVSELGLRLRKGHRTRGPTGETISPVEIGGVSGSPAFARSSKGGFRLVGFVKMGGSSADPIFVAHAAFLNSDGSLSR